MLNSITHPSGFAHGEIVVVTDDGDRENEGDLIIAASLCTTETWPSHPQLLRHRLRASDRRRGEAAATRADGGDERRAPRHCLYGLSRCQTWDDYGISAEQRCNTVRALAIAIWARATSCARGTCFLSSREGGVLMRSGHTEAAVDLCKLAGLPPVAAICELANDDDTVSRQQIVEFADRHRLKRISVAELIAYRQARESWSSGSPAFPSRRHSACCRSTTIDALRPGCISLSCRKGSARVATCRRGCIGPIL